MDTAADQLSVRRANLALVLDRLRLAGPRSRARIATETGLNRATVSSLVADLAERGLVAEGDLSRGRVGRPAQAVELAGSACGLGVEVNVDYVAVHVLDLRGEDVARERTSADVRSLGPAAALDLMAEIVARTFDEVTEGGRMVVGITVAVPGMVQTGTGVTTLAPNLQWRDVSVAAELRQRLESTGIGPGALPPIQVDNEANLAALAEYHVGVAAGVRHFVYLTGAVGIGAGVVVDGQILRGADGHAGEVGHMPIGDPEIACGCGRYGCWETVAGMSATLRAVADDGDPIADPTLDVDYRLEQVRLRADSGDPRAREGLAQVGMSLGRGASVLAEVFNPGVIVFGGFVAVLADHLLPAIEEQLAARVLAPSIGECSIAVSTLGFTAAARGGATVALEPVFADPTSFRVDREPATAVATGGHR